MDIKYFTFHTIFPRGSRTDVQKIARYYDDLGR